MDKLDVGMRRLVVTLACVL